MTPQQTIETDPTKTQSFGDWFQANTRLVSIGAAIVFIAGIGYWFYMRSAEIKRVNAERGLNQAKQSLMAGNAALAQNDLQRVASRYKGTPAGSQAAMLLAQSHYDQSKFAEGINVLDPHVAGNVSGPNVPAMLALKGDGQLGLGRPVEAAESYRKAADATSMAGEKAIYMAKSGRALMIAGKDAEARTLWEKLLDDPDAAAVRSEAQVRLGELSAKVAGKS